MAASGLQDDFTPQTLLFKKKEKVKPPGLSVFAVSATGVAVPKLERYREKRGVERESG